MTTNWCLVASHGTVLFYLAAHRQATIREVASCVDLTERRVSQIIQDLADEEMLTVERHGRRNVYQINDKAPFANPLREVSVGEVVKLIQGADDTSPA